MYMKVGKRRKTFSSGFTIVELLIVIVVIAILAAITLVAYNSIQSRARASASASSAASVGKKVATYLLQNSDQVPVDLAAVGIVSTSDTNYQYTPNTTVMPQLYCATVTINGVSSHIASGGGVKDGPCLGHTGTAPTTLADGTSCPANYILVPGSSLFGTDEFCIMKYEAKIVGQANGAQTYSASFVAESRADGTPWTNVSQINAIAEASALGAAYHLVTEAEWLTLAHNVLSVPSNWSNGSVGSNYIFMGHNDNSPANPIAASTTDSDGYNGTGNSSGSGPTQRRTLTLTNGEVIWDFAGNVGELTQGTILANQLPGVIGENSYTYKQYNASDLTLNGLPTSALPKYGTAAASLWTTSQGIGQVFTNYGETQTFTRGFYRGGAYNTSGSAGVLSLALVTGSGSVGGVTVGFRVAR